MPIFIHLIMLIVFSSYHDLDLSTNICWASYFTTLHGEFDQVIFGTELNHGVLQMQQAQQV